MSANFSNAVKAGDGGGQREQIMRNNKPLFPRATEEESMPPKSPVEAY